MPFGIETFVENASNLFGMGNKLKDRERKENLESYREQERTGIMSRVEGAKAAGLHPLAALGYQSGPGPTSVIGGTSVAPGSFDGAFQSDPKKPEVDQDLRAAQIRNLNAQALKNEVDAQDVSMQNANRALATQPGQGPLFPTDADNVAVGQAGGAIPGVKIKANEITSSMNGIESGVQPYGASIRGPDGKLWKGLSRNVLDQLEDAEFAKLVLLGILNKDRLLEYSSQAKDDLVRSANESAGRNLAETWAPWLKHLPGSLTGYRKPVHPRDRR